MNKIKKQAMNTSYILLHILIPDHLLRDTLAYKAYLTTILGKIL